MIISSSQKAFFAHQLAVVETDDIGLGTRIWAFAHVMPEARIGCNCNICDHAFIESGVILGDNVTVKNGVALWRGITIEDNVFLGPNCVFTNDRNPRAYIKKAGRELTPTLIRANATVGANATILCGLTIGQHAFVGAGAVVLSSIPDFGLVVGNPAKLIGWMCACAHRLPLPAQLEANAVATCSRCHTRFCLSPNGLVMGDGHESRTQRWQNNRARR